MLAFKVKIQGLSEASSNEGIHCLDGLQKHEIENSFYVTSDKTQSTSITTAFKSPNSVEECKFSGNISDGFESTFDSDC